MKIGCCIKLKDLDTFNILNKFDFVEVRYAELHEIGKRISSGKIYAVNNIYPRDKNIFEEDLNTTLEYLKKVLQNCASFNVKIVTFGSGTARIFKESHNITKNIEIWYKILKEIDSEAGKLGIKVGIEPLNSEETNFIKSIEDAAFYIDQLGLKNTGITLDSYHFYKESSSIESIICNAEKIIHFHIASDERKFPIEISEKLKALFLELRSVSYTGNVSIEVDWREELLNDDSIILEIKKQ